MQPFRKLTSLMCVLALTLAMSCFPAAAETADFAGGSGTVADPYQVATAEQLDAVRNDMTACYVLTADVDLSSVENWTPIGWFDFTATDEAGYYANGFAGTFDGDGHTISNLTSSQPEGVGVSLFGLTTSEGAVRNLTVENAVVEGYMAVGGIIGYHCGMAENLTLKGENAISGINCTGGIAGGSDFGVIQNCTVESATVNVLGDNDFSDGPIIQADVAECGGLIVGGGFGGTVENCDARGEIVAVGSEPIGLGGIGGCLEYMDSVRNCTVDVTITAPQSAHAVGGLCGYAGTGDAEQPTEIRGCTIRFAMDVPGATHIGGVVGTGLYFMGIETVYDVADCDVEGAFSGAVTPGAIAGRAEGCTIGDNAANVTLDGETLTNAIGETDRMYESADQ